MERKRIIKAVTESAPAKAIIKRGRLEVAKRGAKLYDFQDPHHFIEEMAELSKSRFPVIYMNHQSHIDIGPLMEASNRLNKLLKKPLEYNLPVAVSIND